MQVIYIDDSTVIEKETATTIGFFDGVHRGHRHLIKQLKKQAQALNLPTSVITFSEHPGKVIQNNRSIQLLNSFDERIQLLASTGIDYCYVIDFTKKFARTSAEDFIKEKLHKQFNIKMLLVGYDHKFGKGRSGDFQQYLEYGKDCGITVEKAERLHNEEVSISSTKIRNDLREGDVESAAKMLSYNYTLEGAVIIGNKLGRTIHFPTANLELIEKDKLIPLEGVYTAWAHIDDQKYQGMIYIGKRPTVSTQGEERIEIHIFNFNQDIYGKKIQIEFVDFLRQDISFNGIEELQKQLEKDKEIAIQRLSNITNASRHCEAKS